MNTYPSIETERLILNAPRFEDIPSIVAYAANVRVSETTMNIPYPYTEKDAIFWINSALQGFENRSQYTFAIRTKSSREFMGGVGLKVNQRFNRATLGYWMAEPFWNRGFMTEAVNQLLHFGFTQVGLHKIYATHLVENPSSGKVMIKNGMIQEGVLKDHYRKNGVYKSIIQYRLTEDEFAALHAD